MLTLQEANERIAEIVYNASQTKDAKELRKLTKSKKRWDIAKLYLETNPSKEYLIAEKKRLTMLLFSINDQFSIWHKLQPDGKTYQEYRDEYHKIKEVPKHKLHLSTVNFLLKQ